MEKNHAKVRVTRDLKVRLLSDLLKGEINLLDYPEFAKAGDLQTEEFLNSLTDEEKTALLAIGRKHP